MGHERRANHGDRPTDEQGETQGHLDSAEEGDEPGRIEEREGAGDKVADGVMFASLRAPNQTNTTPSEIRSPVRPALRSTATTRCSTSPYSATPRRASVSGS